LLLWREIDENEIVPQTATLGSVMLDVLNVTAPVFALVLCGYVAAARSMLPAGAIDGINAFVYWFALPAMLFRVAGLRPIGELFEPRLAAGIAVAGLVSFALAYSLARRSRFLGARPVSEAASFALGAAHGNVGYLGIALLGQLGEHLLPTVTVAIITDNIVLIALTIAILEMQRNQRGGMLGSIGTASRSVLVSPLLGSILLGLAFSAAGFKLPQSVDTFTRMLSGAAGPCALFAIGAALGNKPLRFNREIGVLLGIKLMVTPLVAAIMMVAVLPLEPTLAAAGVVCAALPAASNTFIIAQRYGLPTASVSAAILGGTLIAVVTVSAIIWATGLR
jgi:predicted permease